MGQHNEADFCLGREIASRRDVTPGAKLVYAAIGFVTDREVSQAEIANMVGLSRPSVNRAIGELQRRGLLSQMKAVGQRRLDNKASSYVIPSKINGSKVSLQEVCKDSLQPEVKILDSGNKMEAKAPSPGVKKLNSRSKTNGFAASELVGLYNDCITENKDPKGVGSKGLKICRKLTAKRERGLRRLYTELGSKDEVVSYFKKCSDMPFMRGESDIGYRADIEYITREEVIAKVLEYEGEEDGVVDLSSTYAEKERLARMLQDGRTKVRKYIDRCILGRVSPKNGWEDFWSEVQAWMVQNDCKKLQNNLRVYAKDYYKQQRGVRA